MHVNRSKSSVLACGLLVLGALVISGARGQQSTAKVMTSAKKFKNIKILKTLPADQMIPTMQHISRSLGVRCEFCHAEPNMASDAKHAKLAAREMLVMTNNLNKNVRVVDHKVTCFMCHRGSPQPAGNVDNGGPRGGERPNGGRPD